MQFSAPPQWNTKNWCGLNSSDIGIFDFFFKNVIKNTASIHSDVWYLILVNISKFYNFMIGNMKTYCCTFSEHHLGFCSPKIMIIQFNKNSHIQDNIQKNNHKNNLQNLHSNLVLTVHLHSNGHLESIWQKTVTRASMSKFKLFCDL